MRIFVTGATGFIGSAVVPELTWRPQGTGADTDGSWRRREMRAAGADVKHGNLEARQLAGRNRKSDGVIHLAFNRLLAIPEKL